MVACLMGGGGGVWPVHAAAMLDLSTNSYACAGLSHAGVDRGPVHAAASST